MPSCCGEEMKYTRTIHCPDGYTRVEIYKCSKCGKTTMLRCNTFMGYTEELDDCIGDPCNCENKS